MEISVPSCFKAYDIRGRVPEELDDELARKIGRGLTHLFGVKKAVVGRDMRLSGPSLVDSLMEGLRQGGCEVLSIGLCGTEEIYHAAFSMESQGVDCGIIVTASHNPADYNGMKIVMKGAKPLSGDTGLKKLGKFVLQEDPGVAAATPGNLQEGSCQEEYIEHLLGYIDVAALKPLKIVANCGNGCAGPVLERLAARLPFSFHMLHPQPDGTFPNGVPNPLLTENREETSAAVIQHGADMGLAWDGDFDRCFFWDEQGRFIEGYYLVSLLARELLLKNPGEKILHDPRLVWNTVDQVKLGGGEPIMTRTGHAFIKERMREENGLYGGEMSAHHYFREFGYCDSGMVPWLLVASLLSRLEKPLSSLVHDMVGAYPVSGEINSTVKDPDGIIDALKEKYADGEMDFTDGLSVAYDTFRFNVRKSNTEPLLRLNVETRGDNELLKEKTEELLSLIRKDS